MRVRENCEIGREKAVTYHRITKNYNRVCLLVSRLAGQNPRAVQQERLVSESLSSPRSLHHYVNTTPTRYSGSDVHRFHHCGSDVFVDQVVVLVPYSTWPPGFCLCRVKLGRKLMLQQVAQSGAESLHFSFVSPEKNTVSKEGDYYRLLLQPFIFFKPI